MRLHFFVMILKWLGLLLTFELNNYVYLLSLSCLKKYYVFFKQ